MWLCWHEVSCGDVCVPDAVPEQLVGVVAENWGAEKDQRLDPWASEGRWDLYAANKHPVEKGRVGNPNRLPCRLGTLGRCFDFPWWWLVA